MSSVHIDSPKCSSLLYERISVNLWLSTQHVQHVNWWRCRQSCHVSPSYADVDIIGAHALWCCTLFRLQECRVQSNFSTIPVQLPAPCPEPRGAVDPYPFLIHQADFFIVYMYVCVLCQIVFYDRKSDFSVFIACQFLCVHCLCCVSVMQI